MPPNTSTAFSERAPTASATAEEFPLAEAEDPFPVVLGRNADVGRAGEPPPGGVQFGHREAMVGQEQADIPVAQPLVTRHLVVATPQRQTREAAAPGSGEPLLEGDPGPERARAQHRVARAEGHRCAETGKDGLAGAGHRGRRVLVTIVPSVSENGTGGVSGAREMVATRA